MQGFINPKVMDESTKEADHFRATNANFNAETNKQFVAADEEYEYCPNCSRKFFTGRLRLHLKSCKDGKPLKPLKNKTSRDQNPGENKDQFFELNKTSENNTSYRVQNDEEGNELRSSFGVNGIDSTRDKSPTVESLKSKQNFQETSPLRESFKTPKKEKVNPAETFSGDRGYNKENIDEDHEEQNEGNNEENEENEGDNKNAYEMGGEVEMKRADDNRVPCSICGRNFYEDRIQQHENACKKSNKKRAVFDTSKQRAIPDSETGMKKPTDKTKSKKSIIPPKAEKIVEEEKKPVEAQKEDKSAKKANWKAQHENFIENIRFNRKLKEMEAKGEDIKGLVAPTLINDDYVHCSYCNRKFAPKTAERHIPKCKNTFNRPKPPKNLQLDKIEDGQKVDRTKAKFILKKGFNARMSPSHGDPKSPVTPNPNGQNNTSTDKFNKNASHRSPHSNFSTGNYENQIDESFKNKSSPKESAKKSQMSNLKTESKIVFKKLNSLNDTGKTLNEIKNGQDTSPQGHEIKLPDKKGRDYRSQSPGGLRDGKKVFTEAMPKKEDLLVNYQNIFDRSSGYSTECCPYCSRKFSQHAAERHIPVCKNLKSKPLPLRKNDQDATITEEKFKSKMFMTGLGTKAGFNKRGEGTENGENPKSVPKGPSTDYERFFSSKSKINRSGEKPPLPTRKPLNGGLIDANEVIPERVSMLQKAKLAAAHSASSFCTSCGTKTLKTHNFCGFCGTKKGASKEKN